MEDYFSEAGSDGGNHLAACAAMDLLRPTPSSREFNNLSESLKRIDANTVEAQYERGFRTIVTNEGKTMTSLRVFAEAGSLI